MKIVIAILALILVSGCRTQPARTWTDVEYKNQPDEYERKDYFEICIGQSVHSQIPVPTQLRVDCIKAILGNS
jgi:hypothetical protein